MRERFLKAIQKKAKHGFAGYPTATFAFYGPTASLASKLTVAIVMGEDQDPVEMRRWFAEGRDIRGDHAVFEEALAFIRAWNVRSVAMPDAVLGCPHEEGVDYPEGESCPSCTWWHGRDRFAGLFKH